MLDFHPLQLEDLPRLRQFFGYSRSRICDTTPGTVFIWRDIYKTEWAIYGGSLYFKVEYPGLGPTFTLPLGGGRPEHYRQIADFCCRRDMPIAFYPVPKDELDQLQEFFPASTAVGERNNFDYLYRAEDLKYFRGKKLSGQRNHVNKFLKTYGNWTFRPITPEMSSGAMGRKVQLPYVFKNLFTWLRWPLSFLPRKYFKSSARYR